MYSFGKQSLQNLSSCSEELRRVAYRALGYGLMDFSVIEGHRDQHTQDKYYDMGVSKVKWPDGKHNSLPSKAFDLNPYDHRFKCGLIGNDIQVRHFMVTYKMSMSDVRSYITTQYHRMAMLISAAAKEEKVPMRWGGDWDRDNDILDQSFNDLAHFERI